MARLNREQRGVNVPMVGVEEEYQLVDPATGALRSRADRVLGMSWTEDLEGELQDTMVEVQTPPSVTMAEIAKHLRRRRLTAATAAAADDLEIVAAGVHPFSDWRAHAMAQGDRPEMLATRFGRVAMDEHTFGMHVHVARPKRLDPGRLLREARWLTPALVGLSASSPYFQDADTGYASYRSIVHRRYPLNGPPPDLRAGAEHERMLDTLIAGGLIPDRGTVYWSVRLNHKHPTVEFRGADACPSLHDAAALAALARAAVIHIAEGRSLRPNRATPWDHALLDLNEWQAARYGLDATILLSDDPGTARPLRHEVERLLHLLGPTLERVGDSRAVRSIERILADGNTADRMRRVFAVRSAMQDLMEWLRDETHAGLYRTTDGGA